MRLCQEGSEEPNKNFLQKRIFVTIKLERWQNILQLQKMQSPEPAVLGLDSGPTTYGCVILDLPFCYLKNKWWW